MVVLSDYNLTDDLTLGNQGYSSWSSPSQPPQSCLPAPIYGSPAVLNSIHSHRGLPMPRARWATFILLTCSFVVTTLFWAAAIAEVVINLRLVLIHGMNLELTESFGLGSKTMLRVILVEWWCIAFQVLPAYHFLII